MAVKQIIEGAYNNMLNKQEELYQTRMSICKDCKLYKIDRILGPICNSGLFLNIKTGEVSRKPLNGYVNGCGCILRAKTRVPSAKCPLKKW